MPIFRWLIICLAVWLAIAILRQLLTRRRQTLSNRDSSRLPEYSDMVACAQCNVHTVKSEAINLGGRYYCSEACANSYPDIEK